MRPLAAAVLVLAVLSAPARADELIRFRTPDGVLGLVDHEDKVPPGAAILSRDPKPARAAQPALDPGPAADEEAPADAAAPRQAAAHAFPAAPAEGAAAGDEAALIADWCQQSTDIRRAREQAEVDAERARESYEKCRLVDSYCSEREVEAADERLEDALADEEEIADACRRAECLPGWIREGCESLP